MHRKEVLLWKIVLMTRRRLEFESNRVSNKEIGEYRETIWGRWMNGARLLSWRRRKEWRRREES